MFSMKHEPHEIIALVEFISVILKRMIIKIEKKCFQTIVYKKS